MCVCVCGTSLLSCILPPSLCQERSFTRQQLLSLPLSLSLSPPLTSKGQRVHDQVFRGGCAARLWEQCTEHELALFRPAEAHH